MGRLARQACPLMRRGGGLRGVVSSCLDDGRGGGATSRLASVSTLRGTYLGAATRVERYLLPRGRAASPLCLLVSSLFIFVSFLDRDLAAAAVRPVQTTKVPRAIVPSYPRKVPAYPSTLVPARPSTTWIRLPPLHAAFSNTPLPVLYREDVQSWNAEGKRYIGMGLPSFLTIHYPLHSPSDQPNIFWKHPSTAHP